MTPDPRQRLQLARAHAAAVGREAAHAAGRAGPGRTGCDPVEASILIRPDRPDDARAVDRLAGLDSATVPPAPLLLAEVGGELRAALSLANGAAIADPFHRTAELVTLLRTRAGQLQAEPRRRQGLLERLRRARPQDRARRSSLAAR